MHETLSEDQKQAEIKRLTQCKKWKRQWRGGVKLPGDKEEEEKGDRHDMARNGRAVGGKHLGCLRTWLYPETSPRDSQPLPC